MYWLFYRDDKLEKQYRLYCPRCSLLIAYETTPHLKGGAYTYVVQGALNEIQGVPHDDWALELPGQEHHQDDVHGDGDDDKEMKVRMEGNQDAAAKARALLAASASAGA